MMPADAIGMADLRLRDLQAISKRLNDSTDQLNTALESIQNKLNALGLGIELWHPLSRRPVDREDLPQTGEVKAFEEQQLGYSKIGDGWALATRTVHLQARDGEKVTTVRIDEPKPLLRASRTLRVETVHHIPRLLGRLQKEAVKIIGAVEHAKVIAASIE